MSKKSAEVKKLKLFTRDQLSDMLKDVTASIGSFVRAGKNAPANLLVKLSEIKAALRGKNHKYKQFHKANRNKPQMKR